jgi:PrtD family type I secretion system ABC transporter
MLVIPSLCFRVRRMSGLSFETVLELLRFTHILGFAAGIGGAIFADVLGIHLLFSRRRPELGAILDFVHKLVLSGLAVLWLSGLTIAFIRFYGSDVPAKVITKFILAALLTGNIVLIRNAVLPLANSRPAPLLNYMSAREALLISLCGSLSFAFWLSALMFAKFSFLQKLELPIQLSLSALFWLACFLGLVFVMFAGRLAFAIQRNGWKSGFAEWLTTNMPPNVEQAIAAKREWLRVIRSGPGQHVPRRADPDRPGPGIARLLRPVETVAAGLNDDEKRPEADRKEQPEFDPAPLSTALKACTRPVAGLAGISFVSNMLMLTGPLFMLQVYDRVLTSKSVPTLTALMMLVACMFAFMGVLELIRSRILVRIALRIDRILSGPVFRNVVSVAPWQGGGQRTRLIHDLDHIRNFVAGPAPAAFFDLPWTPIYFLVIFLFHSVLGVIALAGAALLVALSLVNEVLSRKPVAEAARQLARGISLADAGRRNAEAIHAMGMASDYQRCWQNTHREGLARQARAGDIAGGLSVASRMIRLFLQSFMLGAGAYFAIRQEITPGVIIAVSIIMARALAPIEQVVGQWRNLIGARQGLGRIRTALDSRPDYGNRIRLPQPEGHVTVENLFIAPPGSTDPILRGIDFRLDPGDVLVVIGANATGKSTLARALVGVWQPLRGNVRLDGAALQQWLPEQLGRHIGYLPQNVELFEGSIAANIARFAADADPGAVVAAARKAHAHDMILQLPDGYGTRIGEDGAVLSGGQRQRIGLARAFFDDPALIVLDEPNANLDPDGDAALFKTIEGARRENRTVVVIAHKANMIKAATKILLLSDGRQAAFGPRDEILLRSKSALRPSMQRKTNVSPLKPVVSNQPA